MCRMYGMHPAYRFYRIYGKHLSKKVGDPDITFSQVCLYRVAQKNGTIFLVCLKFIKY